MIPETLQPSHRILYVGTVHALPALLGDALNCLVVRCPCDDTLSRLLLKSGLKYSLLLFDDDLPDVAELERFTRSLKHRECMTIVVVRRSDGFGYLVEMVKGLLGG